MDFSGLKTFSNTSIGNISTANKYLDGTGVIVPIMTATLDGSYIKSIIIKAQGPTSLGMIRLFINDGSSNNFLIREIIVPETNHLNTKKTFYYTIYLSMFLKPRFSLGFSTDKADTFSIVVDSVSFSNCDCSQK